MSYIEISLGNLTANYLLLRNKLAQNIACAAAIKADAYGLGADEVSKALCDVGCRDFFVAHLGEAVITKNAKCNTYLLHGVSSHEEAKIVAQNNITPILSSREHVEIYNQYCQSTNQKLPVILNFDTGMGRLGLAYSDINKLKYDHLQLRYIMSHLACADESDHRHNQMQLDNLHKILPAFPGIKVTLANSSGIFLGSKYHFDMVRPGCALYGINPTPALANPMLNVVTIYARIIQRRILEQDQEVGYGATHRLVAGSKVFVVEYGYADGYLRSLSGHSKCFAGGQYLDIAGRISMDLAIIDASSLPESLFNQITHVELLGEHLPVDEIASAAGTIGYEILTNLSKRVRREYV